MKRKSFYTKIELEMFSLISDGHIGGPKLSTIMASLSANNSETVGHKDQRFGQIVYLLVLYNISFSWFLPLDGFKFIFLCRVHWVTVKTKKFWLLREANNDSATFPLLLKKETFHFRMILH